MPKKQPEQNEIKISPAKGRLMLYWVGKKPLDYVKGYPAQLLEIFDPLRTGSKYEAPEYKDLEKNCFICNVEHCIMETLHYGFA